jgi:hypothetical protein
VAAAPAGCGGAVTYSITHVAGLADFELALAPSAPWGDGSAADAWRPHVLATTDFGAMAHTAAFGVPVGHASDVGTDRNAANYLRGRAVRGTCAGACTFRLTARQDGGSDVNGAPLTPTPTPSPSPSAPGPLVFTPAVPLSLNAPPYPDALGILAGGHEPGGGMEQGAETVPVTGDTDVTGDDLIEGRDDGLGRGRIGGRGGLDRRRRRWRPGGDRSGAGQDEGGREDGKAHQMFSRKGDYDSPSEGVSSAERRPQTLSKTGPACPNTDVFRCPTDQVSTVEDQGMGD